MQWRKIGNVYCPENDDLYTHAMFPEIEIVDELQVKSAFIILIVTRVITDFQLIWMQSWSERVFL